MSLSRDELLRPTLTGTTIAKAPYSLRAAFLTAFFGGPFAAIAIAAVNAVRLQRWIRDLAPLGLAVIAYVAFVMALAWTDWGASLRAGLTEVAGGRAVPSYLHRLIALGLFGLGYALHRKEERSAAFTGLERPNGWIAGLACCAGGIALQIGLAALLPDAFRP